jgi:hypothetical protein
MTFAIFAPYGMYSMRNPYILIRKYEEKRPLGRPRLEGMIILEWIFEKLDVRMWTGFIWFKIGTSSEFL